MKTPGLEGFCDLVYEGPNNWENRIHKPVSIYLLWSNGQNWLTKKMYEMNYGDYTSISTNEISKEYLASGLALIYPSLDLLEPELNLLPEKKVWFSEVPAWRNTSGFYNEFTQVSYQADIEPLPQKASLLTFHPFIQYGDVINNLLVLNVTKDPKILKGKISLFNSHDKSFVAEFFDNLEVECLQTAPMVEVLQKTDLYISISSQTLFEASSLGIPVIYYKKDK